MQDYCWLAVMSFLLVALGILAYLEQHPDREPRS